MRDLNFDADPTLAAIGKWFDHLDEQKEKGSVAYMDITAARLGVRRIIAEALGIDMVASALGSGDER